MAQALIAPKLASGDSAAATAANGGIWVRNYGERVPLRGGAWSGGSDAGLAALLLYDRRVLSYATVGFRPAFAA
jgi:hypothetical protein